MESMSKRNNEKRVANETRKHKLTMAFTVTLCIIAAIAIFAYIINGIINKKYNSYQMLSTTARQDSNSVHYQGFAGNILKYSRDGASLLTPDGEVVWNGSYEMNNPRAATEGTYAIVADVGGKEAYVYNGGDSGTEIEETLPILMADVSSQGVAALALEDAKSNEIHIYNPYATGDKLLFKIPTNVSEDGYPVDFSLSEDGKKLITSFLFLNNGVMQSKITFYNFGAVGETHTNFIVGSKVLDKQVCPKVDFLNADTICVYKEQGFMLYSMEETPDKVCDIDLEQPIKSTFHNQKQIGFVLEDNTLLLYNMQGKKLLEKELSFDYDEVTCSDREIIFKADLSCKLMQFNGELKWDYRFDKGIRYFLATQKKNQFVVIDDVNIEKIKLTGDKES
ncbi:MAG: hypothetical protein PWP24_1788 [Clostridiales bacterium]|nr:hypothetical protein [Clostridiales bacterium]